MFLIQNVTQNSRRKRAALVEYCISAVMWGLPFVAKPSLLLNYARAVDVLSEKVHQGMGCDCSFVCVLSYYGSVMLFSFLDLFVRFACANHARWCVYEPGRRGGCDVGSYRGMAR